VPATAIYYKAKKPKKERKKSQEILNSPITLHAKKNSPEN
jgi:hypothetical protein